MIIKINKPEIIEEAIVNHNGSKKFKIDNMDKVRKFSRRGIKAINNVKPGQLKKRLNTIGFMPVVGTIGGALLGSQVDDDDGDTYDGTGAAIGTAAGLAADARGIQKVSTPADTAKFKERVRRDGFQPNDNYNNTVDRANIMAQQHILKKNLTQI